MNLTAEVVAKVETAMETAENGVQYMLHIKLSVDGNPLEAQGGGILAAVKVSEEDFSDYNVGDEIHFEEIDYTSDDDNVSSIFSNKEEETV